MFPKHSLAHKRSLVEWYVIRSFFDTLSPNRDQLAENHLQGSVIIFRIGHWIWRVHGAYDPWCDDPTMHGAFVYERAIPTECRVMWDFQQYTFRRRKWLIFASWWGKNRNHALCLTNSVYVKRVIYCFKRTSMSYGSLWYLSCLLSTKKRAPTFVQVLHGQNLLAFFRWTDLKPATGWFAWLDDAQLLIIEYESMEGLFLVAKELNSPLCFKVQRFGLYHFALNFWSLSATTILIVLPGKRNKRWCWKCRAIFIRWPYIWITWWTERRAGEPSKHVTLYTRIFPVSSGPKWYTILGLQWIQPK